MLRTGPILGALAGLALSLSAAGEARASDGAARPSTGDGIVFPVEHIHSESCGHPFYAGDWHLFPQEHAHGRGCGHYLANGRWDWFPSAHRHSATCGHFHYDGMWHPFARGHVHGEGCGHHRYGGCWNLLPEGHVHKPGCSHAFVDGEWRAGGDAAPAEDADAPELPVAERPLVLEPRRPPPEPRAARAPPPPQERRIEPVSAEEAALDRIRAADVEVLLDRVIVIVHDRSAALDRAPRHARARERERACDAPPARPRAHAHGLGCGHYYWSGRLYIESPCPNPLYGRFRSRYPGRIR